MAHPIWPLYDLTVRTPRLELRYVDDELAVVLALVAAKGVHDPAFMPFSIEWTDVASPLLERQTMQWYWRCRAELDPAHWHLTLAVIVDATVVGMTSLGATDFATLRTFQTGSWLGREFQGRGIGKEMRQAALHLGFAGFGATQARTAAFEDNGPSLGVTAHLGYRRLGTERRKRRGQAAEIVRFEMLRDEWQERLRRDDIVIDGLEPCLPLLGAEPAELHVSS